MLGEEMRFDGEGRAATILTYGGGHTESDVFVHLPDDRIVVAGDLLWAGLHPRVSDGDAVAWARILERIGDLEAKTVVPGHGTISGPDDMAYMGGYLRQVADLVAEATAAGMDDEAIAALPVPAGSEAWEDHYRFVAGLQALVARGHHGAP
jgi:glyoxylase-like metal-dependent hydrolase (beta-lactamase superfamily II)